jgi:cold shock protein
VKSEENSCLHLQTNIGETEMSKVKGEVKWSRRLKGYGYINPDPGGEEVLLHHSAKQGSELPKLYEGDRVAFETIDQNKEPKAKNAMRYRK